jgi:hypothetical protein
MKTKISMILALLSILLSPYRAITADIDASVDAQQENIASVSLDQKETSQRIRTVVQETDARIQPVKNGVKFLLKSKMAGNRQLFWNDQIGSGQYRLRIQNANPNNKRAWWIFDSRTKTMRSATHRNLVISNEINRGFQIGKAAVVRPFKGEQQQRLHFYSGCQHNVRNDKGKCLDIYGGKNANNQPITFWNCHNGDNQAWAISQIKLVQVKDHDTKDGKFPIKDGDRFVIRSEMKTNRMLYPNEIIGGNQRILRIRDFDAHVVTAYWIFDSRTNTIRNAHYKNWVLTNKRGQGFNINQNAVIRPFTANDKTQPIKFYGGKRQNIRNGGGKCLDVHGGVNAHNRHVIWYNCHNGANQGWRINTIANKPSYKQPLKDGNAFYIRSKMASGKNLFWHEHIGGNQFRLRIHNFNVRNYRVNWKLA